MEWITMNEYVDKTYGPLGTPAREAFEEDMRQFEIEWEQTHDVGSTLKQTRKAQQLTQAQLGKQADVRPSQISRLERGITEGCSFDSLLRIVKALGMKLTLQTPKGQSIQLA